MATKDFRASQLETSKIIGSGSIPGTKVGIAIYSGSIAIDREGGTSDAAMFSKVGNDVFLFVSGTRSNSDFNRTDATLFGGDVVISGTLYAERQVIEVDSVADGDFFVTGNMYVEPDSDSTKSVAFRAANGNDILIVDSTNKRVGIGVSDPDSTLELFSSSTQLKLSNNADDFATFAVGINGDLAITTVDTAGGSANFEVNADGAVDIDANAGSLSLDGSTGINIGTETDVAIDIDATTLDIDASGAVTIDGTSTVSIGAVGEIDIKSDISVLIMSGGSGASPLPNGADTNFFVSGSKDSIGTAVKGTSVFGGDLLVSGSSVFKQHVVMGGSSNSRLYFDSLGAVYGILNGPYIDGNTTTLTIDADNSLKVNYDTDVNFYSATAGTSKPSIHLNNDGRVLIHSGGAASSFDESSGADVSFYVSGSVGSTGTSTRGASVFGGDLVISGNLHGGSYLKINDDIALTGSARFKEQTAPSAGANEAVLYAKDASGVTKLFMKQSDGTEVGPLGSGGSLNDAYDTPNGGGTKSAGAGAIITVDGQPVQIVRNTPGDIVLGVTGSAIFGETSSEFGNHLPPLPGDDTMFFFSGSIGSRGSSTGGVSVFGGDLVSSGTITKLDDTGAASITLDGPGVILSPGTVVEFGNPGENIFGDGTDLYVSSSGDIYYEVNDKLRYHKAGTEFFAIDHNSSNNVSLSSNGTLNLDSGGTGIKLEGNDDTAKVTFHAYGEVRGLRNTIIGSTVAQLNLDTKSGEVGQVTFLTSSAAAGTPDPATKRDVNFFVSGSKFSQGTTDRGTALFNGDLVVSGALHAGRQTMVQRLFWAGGIANGDYRFPSGPEGVTTTTTHAIQHMWTVMGSGSIKALDLWVNEGSTAQATVGVFINESSVSSATIHVTGSFVNNNIFGTGNRGHLFIDFQDPANANFITGSNSFNPGDIITIGLCKTAGSTFTNTMGTLYYEVDTISPHTNLPGGVPG